MLFAIFTLYSRLSNGYWGDHVTLQAIADILYVKINVLSSSSPMFSVTPAICSAQCEVFVDLFYYVGLDKLPVCGSSVEQTLIVPEEPNTLVDKTLDDATIEEGDEHSR